MPERPHDLEKALSEIAAVRGQMARAAEFRGYGPLTVGITGVLALAAGAAQTLWVPQPAATPGAYAGLWSVTAALAAGLIATEALWRSRRLHGGMADSMVRAALEQFLPALVAGFLLTVILVRLAPAQAVLLPGLWQIVFSLGIFATVRILPRAILWVGSWYLATGLANLALGAAAAASPVQPLAPWTMSLPFLAGQSLSAVLLWHAFRGDTARATEFEMEHEGEEND